jgi:putative tryptophan/tyrosine transport system substrate-binding protein
LGDLDVQVRLKAFVEGLQKLGWTNGHNVQIDVRFAGGNDDRFRTWAAQLIALKPDVLIGDSTPSTAALIEKRERCQS